MGNSATPTTPSARVSATPATAAADTPVAAADRREGTGPDRRQSRTDRRTGMDRRVQTRTESGYTGPERRSGKDRRDTTGLERRRGPGRRRSDERRGAEEGEMNPNQFEFVMAVEAYKKVNKRLYPTWTEILEVFTQLGYRKVLPREVNLESVPEPQTWTGEEPEELDEPEGDEQKDAA